MIDSELRNIHTIQQDKERKFNIIYICLLHKLLIFNPNNNTSESIEMDKDIFDKLSEEASKQVKSIK